MIENVGIEKSELYEAAFRNTEKEAEIRGHPTGNTCTEAQLVTSGKALTQGSREDCILRREVWSNLSEASEPSI